MKFYRPCFSNKAIPMCASYMLTGLDRISWSHCPLLSTFWRWDFMCVLLIFLGVVGVRGRIPLMEFGRKTILIQSWLGLTLLDSTKSIFYGGGPWEQHQSQPVKLRSRVKKFRQLYWIVPLVASKELQRKQLLSPQSFPQF